MTTLEWMIIIIGAIFCFFPFILLEIIKLKDNRKNIKKINNWNYQNCWSEKDGLIEWWRNKKTGECISDNEYQKRIKK